MPEISVPEKLRIAATGIFIAGSILSSSGGERQPAPLHKMPSSILPFLKENNYGPIHRAGSVIIFTREGSYGHGGLVKRDGKLYLYTIEHIVDMVRDAKEGFFRIPGIPDVVGQLDASQFTYQPQRTKFPDRIASSPLNPKITEVVQLAIDQGVLEPLEVTPTIPYQGEYVAIPRGDTGLDTELIVTGPDENEALGLEVFSYRDGFVKGSFRDAVCTGRSGGPVLMTGTNGITTNKVVAIFSYVGSMWRVVGDPANIQSGAWRCYADAHAIPTQ